MMVEVKLTQDERGRPVELVPVGGCELSPCIDYRTGKGCHYHQHQEGGLADDGEAEFVVCSHPE